MMTRDTGVAIEQIRVDGGAAANAFLMQFIADIIGIELRVATHEDSAALGAALMGAGGLGVETFARGLAAHPHSQISYGPTMPRAEADRRYAGWRKAVAQVISTS
jgi:glycerol kinase